MPPSKSVTTTQVKIIHRGARLAMALLFAAFLNMLYYE